MGPSFNMTGVLIRRQPREETGRSLDCSDASTKQEHRACQLSPEARKEAWNSSQSPRKEAALPTPSSQTSSLQSCERILFF